MMYANEMIDAARGRRIVDLRPMEQMDAVRIVLHKAYELKGVEPLERDIETTAHDLVVAVCNRYRALTDKEMWLAVQYGLLENFGKDTRLAGSNFLLWIDKYLGSPERAAAIGSAREAMRREGLMLAAGAEDKEAKRAEFAREAPLREWEKFKAAGGRLEITLDGYAAQVHDALVAAGKLRAKDETRTAAEAQARRELGAEEARRRGTGRPVDFTEAGGNAAALVHRTKRILLETYFKTLAANGLELKL